jgi:hypothetical protein
MPTVATNPIERNHCRVELASVSHRAWSATSTGRRVSSIKINPIKTHSNTEVERVEIEQPIGNVGPNTHQQSNQKRSCACPWLQPRSGLLQYYTISGTVSRAAKGPDPWLVRGASLSQGRSSDIVERKADRVNIVNRRWTNGGCRSSVRFLALQLMRLSYRRRAACREAFVVA